MQLAQSQSRSLYRFLRPYTELVSENTNGTRVFDVTWYNNLGLSRERHNNMPPCMMGLFVNATDGSAEGHARVAAVAALKFALAGAMGWKNPSDISLVFYTEKVGVTFSSGQQDVIPVQRLLIPVVYGDTAHPATMELKLVERYAHKDSSFLEFHGRGFKFVLDPKNTSDHTDDEYSKNIAYLTNCHFPSLSNVCDERYFPLRISAEMFSYVLRNFYDMKCVLTEFLIRESKTFISNEIGWDPESIRFKPGRGHNVIVVPPPTQAPPPIHTAAADGINAELCHEVWALVLTKAPPVDTLANTEVVTEREAVALVRVRFAKRLCSSAVAVDATAAAAPAAGPLVGSKRGREKRAPIAGDAGGAVQKQKKSADAKTAEEPAVEQENAKLGTDVAEGYNSDLSDCDWHICDPDCACRGGSDNGN